MDIVSKHAYRTVPVSSYGDIGYRFFMYEGRLACWLGSFDSTGTNYGTFISAGPDLRDTMFHHVALCFERHATNGGALYADGQNVLTFSTVGVSGSLSNSSVLYVGSDAYFNGLIDELAIYTRALSPSEVFGIWQSGAAGKCAPPPKISAVLLPPTASSPEVQLGLAGIPGRAYTLERAEQLSGPWTPLGILTGDVNGRGTFLDSNAPPTAFYRTVQP